MNINLNRLLTEASLETIAQTLSGMAQNSGGPEMAIFDLEGWRVVFEDRAGSWQLSYCGKLH